MAEWFVRRYGDAMSTPLGLFLFFATIAGMELVAYAAHRWVMHGVGWFLHESHHRPRPGTWELNDLYAVIFAVPPVVRLVERGVRDVPATVVEAAISAGSTPRQLLWKVQLPMARGGLLVAANQGVVMVLAMVVVGGLVGAGALGYDVVSGFSQREDFGKGLAAGFAIVLLGVLLDRLTHGFSRGAGGRR